MQSGQSEQSIHNYVFLITRYFVFNGLLKSRSGVSGQHAQGRLHTGSRGIAPGTQTPSTIPRPIKREPRILGKRQVAPLKDADNNHWRVMVVLIPVRLQGTDQCTVVLAVLARQVSDGGGDAGAEQPLSLVQVALVDRLQKVVVPGSEQKVDEQILLRFSTAAVGPAPPRTAGSLTSFRKKDSLVQSSPRLCIASPLTHLLYVVCPFT